MISVCMPYWNRPRELQRSMAAYAKVYPELDLEFSICDDGSVVPLRERDNCTITRLPRHDNALNPCVPINIAVNQSKHDIIVLTNPEVEHREPILQRMLGMLTDSGDYVMAGCIEATTGARIAGLGTPYGTSGRKPIPAGSDLHFCAMFTRELWVDAGGFDEEYRHGLGCDDNDWLWRLWYVGATFKRLDADVYHYRTPHRWTGTLEKNAALLEKKWGWLREFQCQ